MCRTENGNERRKRNLLGSSFLAFFVMGLLAVLFMSNPAISGPLDTWTQRPYPTGVIPQDLLGITYGNGTFVAVGRNGTILTSTDGSTWVSPPFGIVGLQLNGVAYGNGTFVIVENQGNIFTSTDALHWTLSYGPGLGNTGNALWEITYAGGTFVAVGGGSILTSPDGSTWTPATTGVPTSAVLFGITYGNGTFVAVGTGGTIVYSTDNGLTWNPPLSFTSPPGPAYYTQVAYGNGKFVAVFGSSFGSSYCVSPDGMNWTGPSGTSQTFGASYAAHGITFANNTFVAVGLYSNTSTSGDVRTLAATTLYSSDASSWTASTFFINQNPLYGVTYGNNTFVAVGLGGTIFQSGPLPGVQNSLFVTISPSGGGTVTGGGSYPPGATATLQATPNAGYAFSYWGGAVSGTTNPISFPMDANKDVTANFVLIPVPVTVQWTQETINGATVCIQSDESGCPQAIYTCPGTVTDCKSCVSSGTPWNPSCWSDILIANNLKYIGGTSYGTKCSTTDVVTEACSYKCIDGRNDCFASPGCGSTVPPCPPATITPGALTGKEVKFSLTSGAVVECLSVQDGKETIYSCTDNSCACTPGSQQRTDWQPLLLSDIDFALNNLKYLGGSSPISYFVTGTCIYRCVDLTTDCLGYPAQGCIP